MVSNRQTDIYKVDTSYKPFPPFSTWAQAAVDAVRWDRYSELVQNRQDVSDELLRKSREIVDHATPALHMRLNIAALRIVSELVNELQAAASKKLRGEK